MLSSEAFAFYILFVFFLLCSQGTSSRSHIAEHENSGATGGIETVSSRPSNQTIISQNNTHHSSRATENSYRRTSHQRQTVSSTSTSNDNCTHCEMQEYLKQRRLNSIKEMILSKLRLNSVPNITTPIRPPAGGILDKVFKNDREAQLLAEGINESDEYHVNKKGLMLYPIQCKYRNTTIALCMSNITW